MHLQDKEMKNCGEPPLRKKYLNAEEYSHTKNSHTWWLVIAAVISSLKEAMGRRDLFSATWLPNNINRFNRGCSTIIKTMKEQLPGHWTTILHYAMNIQLILDFLLKCPQQEALTLNKVLKEGIISKSTKFAHGKD